MTAKARPIPDEQWKDAGAVQSKRPKGSGPWWQNASWFGQVMTKGCERAGILHLSPHDLRHTFGTRFLAKGGEIYVLSKVLGHASVAVTERHYSFMRREDIAAKMRAVMEPTEPPTKPQKPAKPTKRKR